jgi:hypothetical protein
MQFAARPAVSPVARGVDNRERDGVGQAERRRA